MSNFMRFTLRAELVFVVRRRGGEASGAFGGGAGGVEGEEAGENLVLDFGRPVEPGFWGFALISVLLDEFGAGAGGEIVPAIGAQHGGVHVCMERAKAGDIRRILAARVEVVVGLGETFVAVDYQLC